MIKQGDAPKVFRLFMGRGDHKTLRFLSVVVVWDPVTIAPEAVKSMHQITTEVNCYLKDYFQYVEWVFTGYQKAGSVKSLRPVIDTQLLLCHLQCTSTLLGFRRPGLALINVGRW
jgi:hypothetical protein